MTFRVEENDGRTVVGHLPELVFDNAVDPVVQVIDEASGEMLYTIRIRGDRFRPPVFAPGKYLIKVGLNKPDGWTSHPLEPGGEAIHVRF